MAAELPKTYTEMLFNEVAQNPKNTQKFMKMYEQFVGAPKLVCSLLSIDKKWRYPAMVNPDWGLMVVDYYNPVSAENLEEVCDFITKLISRDQKAMKQFGLDMLMDNPDHPGEIHHHLDQFQNEYQIEKREMMHRAACAWQFIAHEEDTKLGLIKKKPGSKCRAIW